MQKITAVVTALGVLSSLSAKPSFASPSDAEKFSRLNGGFELLKATESERRFMVQVGSFGVGTALIIAPQVEASVPQVWTAVGAGLIVGGTLSFFIPSFLDPIQKELDQASTTAAKAEVLERNLRKGAEAMEKARKVGGWVSIAFAPVAVLLGMTPGARMNGLTGWAFAWGGGTLAMGIASLLRPSSLEVLWKDYQDWSGVRSSSSSRLRIEPTISFGAPGVPGLGAGILATF